MIFLQVDYRFYAHGYLESNGHDSSSESSSSDDCALRDSPDMSTPVDKQKPRHQLTRYCA